MIKFKINQNPKVKDKFNAYPQKAKQKLLALRNLIIETATADEGILELEETLKWGEPSYLVKKGSTIRIDWKAKNPDQYALYFKCTSKLVPSFKAVYGSMFNYDNNRAIVFDIEAEIPLTELKACIRAALNYHRLKSEVNLGLEA